MHRDERPDPGRPRNGPVMFDSSPTRNSPRIPRSSSVCAINSNTCSRFVAALVARVTRTGASPSSRKAFTSSASCDVGGSHGMNPVSTQVSGQSDGRGNQCPRGRKEQTVRRLGGHQELVVKLGQSQPAAVLTEWTVGGEDELRCRALRRPRELMGSPTDPAGDRRHRSHLWKAFVARHHSRHHVERHTRNLVQLAVHRAGTSTLWVSTRSARSATHTTES